MKKMRLGISIALMTAALILGLTLGYSSANAKTSIVVGQNGGIAGNGANGGSIHALNGTALNGAAGKDANGLSMSSAK
ncbi:MAG TPA: hypothetical protein VN922_19835 [Bacteroidia bacterium]|nr:hypothetical protein [Bacteroidia bacterium]